MRRLLCCSPILDVNFVLGSRTRFYFQSFVLVCTFIFGWTSQIAAANDADYLRLVRPLLQKRCFACHGALKQEADLRLDSGDLIRAGGESGSTISPDDPSQSLLIQRISASDSGERMPPEGEALEPNQIESLRNWIARGAPSPEDEQPEADPREHWSFQKLTRPAVPVATGVPVVTSPNSDALPARPNPKSPIDSFVLQKLQQHALVSQPRAPKHVLLRRVYIDLIGLPPTRDELYRFLTDDSENAWARIVDRLLDDPRHAERWGRHWMDVWRYSDWYGRRGVPDVWNSAPQIWRWRDWIINSLNQDKGYDRMVIEMLAADEAFPQDRELGYATGFLIRNWYALNPNDWMRSNVEHTGKAFLGLTFNCAHCHDHKYDPISHDDYFRMRAFFEPLYIRQDRVPGEADPGPFQDYDYSTLRKIQHLGSVRVFDKSPDAPTWFYSGGDERNRQEDRGSIPPGVPEFLKFEPVTIEPVRLPSVAWYPGLDNDLQQTLVEESLHAVSEHQSELTALNQDGVKLSPIELDRFAKAEAAYAAELEVASQEGRRTALEGKQSLVLDAMQGRRVLQNRLPQLVSLDDGFTIDFQLLLVSDAYFNFQLANNIDKGSTASMVAFDKGRIVSYQPGSTRGFEVGRYDFSTGQNRFHVRMVLQLDQDQSLLTIHSVSDAQLLVADVPIALNGWNPVDDPSVGIFLDAHTGSIAAVDELVLGNPSLAADQPTVQFSFESPEYLAGQDVIGREHWEPSSFCQAPATSIVTAAPKDAKLSNLEQELDSSRLAVQIPELRLQAAQARLVASQAELASLEARIAADRANDAQSPNGDASMLARIAARSEAEAALRTAEADLARDEHAVAVAKSKPMNDKTREKELASSAKRFAASQVTLEKKRSIQTDRQSEIYSPLSPVYPKTSTGRRRALARWITSRDNPLTARVAINHIWMRHFHAPLVESVYDFGRNGSDPTHPELLDWLAVELIESGWSMKHIHRLIVSSDTYRRSSSATPLDQSNAKSIDGQDVENKLLWRMNTGRMEAEVIRDSLLYSGQLLDFTMKGQTLANDQTAKTGRRSLYYEVFPEDGGASELSDLFDAPSPLDCYRRTRSIVPQQALALTNSDLVHRVSAAIVNAWSASFENSADQTFDPRFVTEVFELTLTRSPSNAELRLCLDGLRTQRKLLKQNASEQVSMKARESLVRTLLNHNDFVTVR